jgi:hypothetical protein
MNPQNPTNHQGHPIRYFGFAEAVSHDPLMPVTANNDIYSILWMFRACIVNILGICFAASGRFIIG